MSYLYVGGGCNSVRSESVCRPRRSPAQKCTSLHTRARVGPIKGSPDGRREGTDSEQRSGLIFLYLRVCAHRDGFSVPATTLIPPALLSRSVGQPQRTKPYTIY